MLLSLVPSEALGETEAEDWEISRTFRCEISFWEAAHAPAEHEKALGPESGQGPLPAVSRPG